MFTLNVKIPCDLNEIEKLEKAIREQLSLYQSSVRDHICFIVHELLINSFEATMKTFSGPSSLYSINAHVEMTHSEYIIHITDECGGVKGEVFTHELEDILLADRGRGLLMVRELVDSISFHQNDEEGLFTVLVKKERGA